MRYLLLLLMVTVLVPIAAAQTQTTIPSSKKLFWTEAPTCGAKTAITLEDKFVCSSMEDDYRMAYRFEHNGFTVTAKLYILGDYFVAETNLENKSGKAKPFNIQEWMIVYFENEDAFKNGQQPLSGAAPEKEPFVSHSQQMEAAMYDNEDIISDLGNSNVSRPQVMTRTGMRPGPAVQTPKNASLPPASKPGSPSSTTKTSTVVTTRRLKTIADKTVAANKKVFGRVYFALEPRSMYRFVSIKVDDVFYIFPIGGELSKADVVTAR